MNWKKFVLLSCVVPCVFAVSTATAQMRGGHRASMARMPMHRAPMLNSASGFNRFNDFDRNDRFRRFNRFNDFDRDDRFRRFRRFNEVVFIGDFGFPWWWGGTGATHTDTTAATTTATTVPVMDTAIAVGLEWPSYSAGSLAPAITMAPSMESWGLRREGQSGRISATMDT